MPMDAGDIEIMIKEALPDARVTIRDLAGDGGRDSTRYLAVRPPADDLVPRSRGHRLDRRGTRVKRRGPGRRDPIPA